MIKLIKKTVSILEKNWIFKIFVFWFLSLFPSKALFYIQNNITTRSEKIVKEINDDWKYIHEQIISKKGFDGSKKYELIEFGAGRDLAQNIYLALMFPNLRQRLVDINIMLNEKFFVNAYYRLCNLLSINPKEFHNNPQGLLKDLRIFYDAPQDISDLSNFHEYDFCISRHTLEHIPKKSLKKIFKNISHIMKIDGLFISCIDYSDHYSHSSKKLSAINYLRYNSFIWFFLNPPNHFQNRLRHSDHIKLMNNSNFEIITDEINISHTGDYKINNMFINYSEEDIRGTFGRIVAKIRKNDE